MTAGQQSVATVVSVNFADDILHQGLGIVTIAWGRHSHARATATLAVTCPSPSALGREALPVAEDVTPWIGHAVSNAEAAARTGRGPGRTPDRHEVPGVTTADRQFMA